VNLAATYEKRVKIVQINIDSSNGRLPVQRYGVRGTPTFILFDAEGKIRGQVPGWPGYEALTQAFDQLLAEG